VWNVLEEFSQDPVEEVAETCQLAIDRVKWLKVRLAFEYFFS
jgi:hypothetical protein